MPLWNIHHPDLAFSDAEKLAIAERITALYGDLPAFYVGVIFNEVSKDSFFIGGRPTTDFVRISVDHIARQINDDGIKEKFLAAISDILAPYVADRGLRWELHIDETPFSLWTIQGFRPPKPGTPEGEKWRIDDRPSAY